MKISAIAPVLNEAPWIGYSILAALPYFHEFIYALDAKSDDGTRELLFHVKQKYAHEKLIIIDFPTFHPHDQKAYNASFNACLAKMTGDVAIFLHPDMLVTEVDPFKLREGPLAWWTTITSYAGDFKTKIGSGRANRWKNIHAKKFGLHYAGGYGSQNEDFYHSEITGNAYKHFGTEFSKYPFEVADSGIAINHYCELKSYSRRLEKMKFCLKTQNPYFTNERIEELAVNHPRVTLESTSTQFGKFEFEEVEENIPEVIKQHKAEFEAFQKELVHG